jgi:hypothetical protein
MNRKKVSFEENSIELYLLFLLFYSFIINKQRIVFSEIKLNSSITRCSITCDRPAQKSD